tara:strand:- start:222 stop:890 length:669 start_codon:yes stop_codon:yes gene_type:complete
MSHFIKFKTTTESGQSGVDSIIHSYNSSEKAQITFTSGGGISLRTPSSSDSTKLFVSDDGFVGIGTTTPTTTLDVSGTAKFETLLTQSVTTTSDVRKKTNIQELENFNLDYLRPVQYNWRNKKNGKKHYGFIAQEIEEVYPNMIKIDKKGFYSMDYLQLVPISIKNLQIQEDNIKELRNEVEYLKGQLELLRKCSSLEYVSSDTSSEVSQVSTLSSEDFDNW